MGETKVNYENEGVKLVTEFASKIYTKGVLDGCKYTLLGMAVGAVCMFTIDSLVERYLKAKSEE